MVLNYAHKLQKNMKTIWTKNVLEYQESRMINLNTEQRFQKLFKFNFCFTS